MAEAAVSDFSPQKIRSVVNGRGGFSTSEKFHIIFTASENISGSTNEVVTLLGNDADLCIVDINKPWIVKYENLLSKSKNTSIENKKLQGKVTNTFVNGEELYKI